MTSGSTALQEVVVVGYGVQQKKSLTGAVATVKEEQLRAIPTGDPASRLQGRAAGVTVTNSNAPGAAATVRVRGYGSLGNNNPLYIVDGIPRTSMDNINPNDIESMTCTKRCILFSHLWLPCCKRGYRCHYKARERGATYFKF